MSEEWIGELLLNLNAPNPEPKVDGYFDFLYSIFEAYDHPVILVEECGMRWMGLRTCPEQNLDLLIRDSQFDAILDDILATGVFDRIEQDLSFRFDDPMAKQIPCLHDTRYPTSTFSRVNLWSESIYQLQVEHVEPVAVQDIHAWNVVLMQEDLFANSPEFAILPTMTAAKWTGMVISPKFLGSARHFPIFVPSIPKMCDALLDQVRYRITHPEEFSTTKAILPRYHLSNFVRYLYLEAPAQRKMLLPLLAPRNREAMEERINAFKRKVPFKLSQSPLAPMT